MRIKFPAPERIFASVADLPTLTVYMELPSPEYPNSSLRGPVWRSIAVPALFQGSEHTALDASIHRDPLSIRGWRQSVAVRNCITVINKVICQCHTIYPILPLITTPPV